MRAGLAVGSTNATAAAVAVLHQLGMPMHHRRRRLAARAGASAGRLSRDARRAACPTCFPPPPRCTRSPVWSVTIPARIRERCLDFLDTLWSAEGGFHGHWADDHLDAEYTFYGLLALGHLSVGS